MVEVRGNEEGNEDRMALIEDIHAIAIRAGPRKREKGEFCAPWGKRFWKKLKATTSR